MSTLDMMNDSLANVTVPSNNSTAAQNSVYEQVYYMIFGILSAIGNSYLILIFILFPKLRQTQCNWLIIFLSISDVMIGCGIFIKGLVYLIEFNYDIDLNFYWCTLVTVIWIGGYRIGQTIALMMATDRFLAIALPTAYMKRQGTIKSVISVCAIIILLVFCVLMFFFLYGADPNLEMTLFWCFALQGDFYFKFVPGYSGTVSILFFITYSISMIIFTRQFSNTKKQQVHAQKQISRVQMKIFITVSMAMFCYSIFYVIPTILQMLTLYFGLPQILFTWSGYVIFYGAEFNGALNAVIYLGKHQEFKESNLKFIYGLRGKSLVSEVKTSKVFLTVRTTVPASVSSAVSTNYMQ